MARTETPVVLVSGFEPFGGDSENPSWDVAEALDGCQLPGPAVIRAVRLPCVYGASTGPLFRAIERHRPVAVLALGLAASRQEVSVERVAINLGDARIADNAGCQPIDQPLVANGPAAYFSTLPVKAIVAAIRAADVAAGLSATAGTFVCNDVFYCLLDHLAKQSRPGPRAGFIHLPWPAGPDSQRSLDDLIRAIRIAATVAVAHQGPDLTLAEGRID